MYRRPPRSIRTVTLFPYTSLFRSLDQLSGGRAGWNLVTSASHIEAANFGSTGLRPHADRYERAREFATVVTGLWRGADTGGLSHDGRSEEHTSELQSLQRISYAVFCLKNKHNQTNINNTQHC